jgi:hypothetical protein
MFDWPRQSSTVPNKMSRYHTLAVDAASVKVMTHAWSDAGTGGNSAIQSPSASGVTLKVVERLSASAVLGELFLQTAFRNTPSVTIV